MYVNDVIRFTERILARNSDKYIQATVNNYLNKSSSAARIRDSINFRQAV